MDDVFVNHDGFIFRRGQVYSESFVARMYETEYRRHHRWPWFLLKNYGLRRGAVDLSSGLWVIDNFSPRSYHHWMVDVLPRIVLGEGLHPSERVLILPAAYGRHPYVAFTLRAFPRIEGLAWIDRRSKAHVRRLAFVPRPPVYLRDLVAEVAHRVGSLVEDSGSLRRVYLSRADAARRRVRNETEVVRVLRSLDFEILRIDSTKPWEQVQATRSASLIVGLHGAELTNVIFMPPGGRLLEFRHGRDEVFVRSYLALAELMGVEYQAQLCDVTDSAPGYAINDADVVVDLDLLKENVGSTET